MNQKVSVIIPFYNTKTKYVERCIDSVINQTYHNIEIIIINDGSTKKKSLFLERYLEFENIIIINQVNHGVSVARNKGIKISSGDWVMFVDSDDWLELDAIEKFVNILKNNNKLEIVFSKCYINNGATKIENYSFYKNSFLVEDKIEIYNSIFENINSKLTCIDTPWAKIFSKKFILENHLKFNPRLKNGEDGIFIFESVYKAQNIYFTMEKTYNYRVNSDSVCNTYYSDMDDRFINLIEEYESLFSKLGVDKEKECFDVFVVRIICRLLRKFYCEINRYNHFKGKIEKLSTHPAIINSISKVKIENLTFGRKCIFMSFKYKFFLIIYFLMKLDIKVK